MGSEEEEEELNSEDDISGYESDGSESGSSSEEDVGIAKNLPRRTTRSSRYQSLLTETKELDDDFWKHNTWDEENDDADYNCSEGEEIYKDTVDTDFDDNESEESSEDESGEKGKDEDGFTKKKKQSVYLDPAKLRKAKKFRKIKRRITKIKNNVAGFESSQKSERSTRATTRRRTVLTENFQKAREDRKKRLLAKRAILHEKMKKEGKFSEWREPTQEEHLREARKTEEINRQSLIMMQAIQEERRRYIESKNLRYKGHYEVYLCWASDRIIVDDNEQQNIEETEKNDDLQDDEFSVVPKMSEIAAKYYRAGEDLYAAELLTFTDGKIPEIYDNDKIKAPEVQLCAVSGKPARYFDPVVGLPFDSVESFKTLRQWFHDVQDMHIFNQFQEIEKLLNDKIMQCERIATGRLQSFG